MVLLFEKLLKKEIQFSDDREVLTEQYEDS